MIDAPAPLVAAVQANCDIANALHAPDLSMCIFLLQMREYFRWQRGLGFDAAMPREALGQWLAETEARWQALEGRPFETLPIGGRTFDAFDVEAVNRSLGALGLVYGAGHAGPGRPTFFLAERQSGVAPLQGLEVHRCGRELARGLFAPPAALQDGRRVVLRLESMARWLWQRYEAFSLKRADGAFAAVARCYGLGDTAAFVAALPRLIDELAPVLLLHELGEHRAAALLEPGWAALRWSLQRARPALQLRAVRDHIADLTVTLPTLLDEGRAAPLHFWFATYEGVRAAMFPALEATYGAWRQGDGGQALRQACERGASHFSALALELLALPDPAAVERRLASAEVILD